MMRLNLALMLAAAILILSVYITFKSNDEETDQVIFACNTAERLSPSKEWFQLKWNLSSPLHCKYLIDNYYINIIETVLLRRPWSNKMLGTAHDDFYSLINKVPNSDDYVYYLYDYRCIIAGNIYFDSRYITNITGPYYKDMGVRKITRSFQIHGFMQSVPFKEEKYESICPDYKNKMKLKSQMDDENGNNKEIELPYSDRIHFIVNITEHWSKFTEYHPNMECNMVTFYIYDFKANPVFSKYNRIMNNNLNHTSFGKHNEYLIIKPGRANYTIFPTEKWPSFDKIFPNEKGSRNLPINEFYLRYRIQ